MNMLANLPRARDVMAASDIDGLVAALSINVYYLSGYWGLLMSAERFDAAFFAVLPAREDLPAALVLPSMELRRLVSAGGTWMPETFIYTSPDGEFDQVAVEGMPYGGWPVRSSAKLTELEQEWIDATAAQVNRVSGNAIGALARAIEAAGLNRGKLVADDARVGDWLRQAGLEEVECRTDAGVFNHIRAVKTPQELELLRKAAVINERALRDAASAFQEGANWTEIEIAYMTAMASQGGKGSYVICGAGGPPAGQIRRNEPMFLDALGTYCQYHGDFGRCVVVGEPDDLMQQRHKALLAGWDAVQPLLKPGTRYSELANVAVEAIRQPWPAGVRLRDAAHGLGLEHTDDPETPAGSQQGMTRGCSVLEAGMVLNIDMPFTEIGLGLGAHRGYRSTLRRTVSRR